LACGRPREIVARLYHIWEVSPRVGSGVPGDCTVANGEIDVAACKDPSAVVGSRGSSGAARRQIGDRTVVPGVGAWIVAPGLVRSGVATARVNVAAQGHGHESMVGKWVVCGH
jgi:hypothetical protein